MLLLSLLRSQDHFDVISTVLQRWVSTVLPTSVMNFWPAENVLLVQRGDGGHISSYDRFVGKYFTVSVL